MKRRKPSSQTIHVTCHSGHSYADRPTSFVWNGELYEISEIEREWLEPGEKYFIVQAAGAKTPQDEKRFEICYDTREDIWRLRENQ
jgi:hypothetical protein